MDSELQIGLVALGVAVVIGILVYNKWQDSKQRRYAESRFRSEHPDVLLEPGTGGAPTSQGGGEPGVGLQEPIVGGGLEPLPDEDWVGEPRVREAGIAAAEVVSPAPAPSGRRTTPGAPVAIDTRIDCMIQVEVIEPIEAQALWRVQHEALRGMDRPVLWFGFDDGNNEWRRLDGGSSGHFHWLCAAIQMVDRRGPLSPEAFDYFVRGVQHVADQFLAVPANNPARSQVLATAGEIDRFCAALDVQVGINIVANEQPFPGTKIRALAEANGMALEADGVFHARDDNRRELYVLANLEGKAFDPAQMRTIQTNGLTLVLDVPHAIGGVFLFDRMVRQAHQMAQALNGRVVDDKQQLFREESIAAVRNRIQHFHERMREAGLSPGDPLTDRLFSVLA